MDENCRVEKIVVNIENQSFEIDFKRSKLFLGKVFYIRIKSNVLKLEESNFIDATQYAVNHIAPSSWTISLIKNFKLSEYDRGRIHRILGQFISKEQINEYIENQLKKLRIDHLYKTEEFKSSRLNNILTICNRLILIQDLKDSYELKSETVPNSIYELQNWNWKSIIIYHLFTCFDLLGQPSPWKNYDSWLDSDEAKEYVRINKLENDLIKMSKNLYSNYIANYGVKNSFFRFIEEILPEIERNKLLNSVKIEMTTNPPNIQKIGVSNIDKIKHLFSLRNNYTHKAEKITTNGHGFTRSDIGSWICLNQYRTSTKFVSIHVQNWPNVIEEVVLTGLKEYISHEI